MYEILISIALAYLLAMSVIGYVMLLTFIRKKKARLGHFFTGTFVIVHFLVGIGGLVILPAVVFSRIKSQMSSDIPIFIFGLTFIVFLLLVFVVLREMNRSSDKKTPIQKD